MTLQNILSAKGDKVHTVSARATLADVARTLVERNVGSLVVCRQDDRGGEQLAGIITERDFLHSCAAGERALAEIEVSEVMSTNLITGSPGDTVEETMALMTGKRIRHLPILSEGRLVGMVSIGDVVKAQLDHLAMENRFMKDYIRS